MPLVTDIKQLYASYIDCKLTVCTDTRKLIPDSLFVCLKGDNFDANDFALKAIEGGCKAVLSSKQELRDHPQVWVVADTLSSLQELAHHHRKQLALPVLAITGSNGKTTNKELIHAVLSRKFSCLATAGNLNNHIGVPLTLLKLRAQHELAIIEMGANHQGEIAALCAIAAPNYGLITNIGKAHLEGFGGVEGVIKGKSELYTYLRKTQGKVFVNGDDALLLSLCEDLDCITYGTGNHNLLSGKELPGGDTLSFSYTINGKTEPTFDHLKIPTHLVGNYNLPNFLAAACIGEHFAVPRKEVHHALSEYKPNMNRSQLTHTKRNRVILDAYNANPDSMRSAIENFAKVEAIEKTLLLGDMFELGAAAEVEHRNVLQLIKDRHFINVYLVGEQFSALVTSPYLNFKSTQDCLRYLEKHPINGHTILIKGSRGMQMEKLLEAL